MKNLNSENAELTERVNELTEKVETLQSSNKTLMEQLVKLETVQKADIASMRTLIEVMRKELEVSQTLSYTSIQTKLMTLNFLLFFTKGFQN